MAELDGIRRFLDGLPEVGADERFTFDCHPGVSCFNVCCRELSLVLNPYDVLRLRQALGLGGRELLKRHCEVAARDDTGFPLVTLRMDTARDSQCPFVTAQGCSVYPHRPGACRAYPLGRAATRDVLGRIQERFVRIEDDFCHGFDEPTERTPRGWADDQGLPEYWRYDDRYLELMAGRAGEPQLDRERFSVALLMLYRLDEVPRFVASRAALAGHEAPPEVPEDERERLLFAIDWLEREL